MNKRYDFAIDILRTISILAVIIIHTSTKIIAWSHNDLNSYAFAFWLNQIFRFAVPLFFLISGYVLELNYSHNKSYFVYIKKRVNKIFIPYIFWSMVYYFFIYK